MKSRVYFLSSRAAFGKSPADRFREMLDRIGLTFLSQGDLVALKLHFGEDGSTGYIHPTYVRTAVHYLKGKNVKPFLTDTNTLYHGARSNGVDHIELAVRNGFTFSVINAPLIIADGIKSHNVCDIDAGPRYFQSVKIGRAIADADALITLNHFKGHLVTGFGGAIKNLSMGCASRATKQRMHADVKPVLKKKKYCIGCGECVSVCPVDAIRIEAGTAQFHHAKCIGCAECIAACPRGAIKIDWSGSSRSVQEKMAEVAMAVNRLFKDKVFHFNFLLRITPECDCLKWTDNPVVQDIGILASTDPVALDQASWDMVTAQPSLPNCVIDPGVPGGKEKFSIIHDGVDPCYQLEYAEKIGLGRRVYERVDIA